MTYLQASDILSRVEERGMRKAFFVTALLLEMEAVRGHLTHLGSVGGHDGAVYECGVFTESGQEWLVVVTETGAGTHPAQSAVNYAHTMFGGFEVQILVGIGGSRKKDAPIGSVVASDHVYMPYSGKYGEHGFASRPRTFQVDGRLIGIAKKVRRDKTWKDRICDPHEGSIPARDSAYPVIYPPAGVVAPIASIEAVLDDDENELEAMLAKYYGDACVVEMEGYGAVYAASMERTPSILVRGVSDMAKKKTPEEDAIRQPIAACHAAAFAFEMLSHWTQLYAKPARDAPVASSPIQTISSSTVGPLASSIALEESPVDLLPAAAKEGSESGSVTGPPAPAMPSTTVSIILNVTVEFGPADAARIEDFQRSLRKIAGSDSVTIVEARAGSLLLFVADPEGALARVGVERLRAALDERDDGELVGMVSVAEYESLRSLPQALAAASSDLISWPTTLPDGERIDRPELGELIARFDENVFSTTAILGLPGAGKSAFLAEVSQRYVAKGWPVLAIKADLLDADISSEADLRDRLGLDELPSRLIQRLATFGPVLLAIDQLDALAGYLDLRTARLSILLSLVRKLGRLHNVHIVLSARTFEFQHDVRLRSVSAESLTLQLPAWSEVLRLLEARGVQAAGWPADAQEVMRTPQALATYLKLNSRYSSEPFSSYQAMLDRLWNERVLAGEGGAKRGRLAGEIADRMADEESLWLAGARFDDQLADLQALEAADVLASRENSIGFTHQTLFEFAIARRFAQEQGRLSQFVLERQNSLFLRPKLWAGLNYLRSVDVNAYHAELEAIWREPDLRRHLRILLIDFLGAQADPTDREALLFEGALGDEEMRWRAFRSLSGSSGWFTRFGKSFIADAMTESDESANIMIDVLSRALTFAPETVTDLIQQRWLPDKRHDPRAWSVFQNATPWSDTALGIAISILGRTDIAPMMVDHVAATIGVDQPDFALRLIGSRLDHELKAAVEQATERAKVPKPKFESYDAELVWYFRYNPGEPIRQVIERGQEWDSLAALAEQSHRAFLEVLWPWFVLSFEALSIVSDEREGYLGYAIPFAADYRFEDERDEGLPEASLLLGALRIAVERFVETDPDEFEGWARSQSDLDVTPVQRLIAHGYAHAPERFATIGLDYLLADTRRFHLGSSHDIRGTSKALVAKLSPYWTEEQVARLEDAIAAYRPPPPPDKTDAGERRGWRHAIRHAQLDLLRSLAAHQMGEAAKRRVAEEERVFGNRRVGSTFSGVRHIGSVMDAAAIAKATDEAVLNAFRILPDATGWDHPRNWMIGGNIQLSREFATFAKQDASRAIRLLGHLDAATGTRAAGYALEAMAENAAPEIVLALLFDVVGRGFDSEEFRTSASRAIDQLGRRGEARGDDVVALLESWLETPASRDQAEDDDTDLIDTGVEPIADPEDAAGDAEDGVHSSLLWGHGGISIVPGGDYPVLEALTRIRAARKEHDLLVDFLDGYLERVRAPKIWRGLAHFLPLLEPAETTRKIAFLDRLFASVPELVGDKVVAHYLANAHWHAPDWVDRQLDAWKTAPGRLARQAYGEIVALTATVRPELDWPRARLEMIVEDNALAAARTGAALTAANLFPDSERREFSSSLLVRLIPRATASVWQAVFDLFRIVDELSPDEHTVALLTAVADNMHEAPQLNATFVVDRLATLLPHHALLVGRLAEGLIEKWRTELGDIRTATAMAASSLVDLVVTLHRLGPETRELGTSLFEQLIAIDAYAARETLDEIDSRFRANAAAPRRRRLPRRSEMQRQRRRRGPE